MRALANLLVRVVVGLLLVGHGGQKLFGWFGGPGMTGTADWLEQLQLRPGRRWAAAAGGSELAGGALTAAGFLNPLGPIAGLGAMAMAWAKVHRGRPIWSSQGGGELPVTNAAVLAAIAIAGPGRLSVDGLLGTGMSRAGGILTLAAAAAALWIGAGADLREEADQAAARLADGTTPASGSNAAASSNVTGGAPAADQDGGAA